jgi:hypothetical protein
MVVKSVRELTVPAGSPLTEDKSSYPIEQFLSNALASWKAITQCSAGGQSHGMQSAHLVSLTFRDFMLTLTS